jgi:asparagine synthase (glutamine-hydrolysing)
MCRIFGHFATDAPRYEMRLAGAAQRHGGPDQQSTVGGRGWSLGSNRLAIMDPNGGRQPYRLGDIVAVFNGEIYNHAELRRDLTNRGYTFTDTCDGSIIPALYREFGESFAGLLDGMFAIALVDLTGEPRLVLATDAIGMKSLYYHWNPTTQQFYFASEIPGLLSFRAVGREMWLPGLEEYLATKTPFGGQTMFEDVRALLPGSTAVVSLSRGVRITRRPHTIPDPNLTGSQQIADEVHHRLDAAVRSLTAADAPVCAITSGGLDSSLVTALASRHVPDLHTFNIAYTGTWPDDERHYAREVADWVGSRHHQVEIDPSMFPEMIPEVVWHLGQPNADPITLSTFALFREVRAAGFKVALTGDAADELFAGYDRLKVAVGAAGDWRRPYLDSLSAIRRDLRSSLYSSDYRAYVATLPAQRDDLDTILRRDGSRLGAMQEVEIGHRLPAYHLRRVDHLSMAHGVEARLPFCQRNVVDLAAALPDTQKIEGQSVKKTLYRAAHGHLPSSVLNRPKQPFTLPITAMLHSGSPLMGYAEDVLHTDRIARAGLLDPRAVRRLLRSQREHPTDRAALAVWSLLVFQTWADEFGVAGRSLVRKSFAPDTFDLMEMPA